MNNHHPLLAEIRSLEEALHRPEVRRSRQAIEELLAPAFVEIGASGTLYHREDIVSLLMEEQDGPDACDLHTDGYVLASISSDAVLLTYRSSRRKSDGTERRTLRSSIWKHTGSGWQMLFHQGTIASPA